MGDWHGYAPDPLQAYCDRLNGMNFSRANGWTWFVNSRRVEDGTRRRYVDRREDKGAAVPYMPSEAEAAATHAITAELVRRGVEPDEFTRMVKNGTITRMVEQRMARQPA